MMMMRPPVNPFRTTTEEAEEEHDLNYYLSPDHTVDDDDDDDESEEEFRTTAEEAKVTEATVDGMLPTTTTKRKRERNHGLVMMTMTTTTTRRRRKRRRIDRSSSTLFEGEELVCDPPRMLTTGGREHDQGRFAGPLTPGGPSSQHSGPRYHHHYYLLDLRMCLLQTLDKERSLPAQHLPLHDDDDENHPLQHRQTGSGYSQIPVNCDEIRRPSRLVEKCVLVRAWQYRTQQGAFSFLPSRCRSTFLQKQSYSHQWRLRSRPKCWIHAGVMYLVMMMMMMMLSVTRVTSLPAWGAARQSSSSSATATASASSWNPLLRTSESKKPRKWHGRRVAANNSVDGGKYLPSKGNDDCPSIVARYQQYRNNSMGQDFPSFDSIWLNPCWGGGSPTAAPSTALDQNQTDNSPNDTRDNSTSSPSSDGMITTTDQDLQGNQIVLDVFVALPPRRRSVGLVVARIVTEYLAKLANPYRYNFNMSDPVDWTGRTSITRSNTGDGSDMVPSWAGPTRIRRMLREKVYPSRFGHLVAHRLRTTAALTIPPSPISVNASTILPGSTTSTSLPLSVSAPTVSPVSWSLAPTAPTGSPTFMPTMFHPLVLVRYDSFKGQLVQQEATRDEWWWQYSIRYSCYYEFDQTTSNNNSSTDILVNNETTSDFNNNSAGNAFASPGETVSSGGVGSGATGGTGSDETANTLILDPFVLRQITDDFYRLLSQEITRTAMMYDISTAAQTDVQELTFQYLILGPEFVQPIAKSPSPAPQTPFPTFISTFPPQGTSFPWRGNGTEPAPDIAVPVDTHAWDTRRYMGLALFLWTCLGTLCLNKLASWRRYRQVQKEHWSGPALLATEEGVDELLRLGWRLNGSQIQVFDKKQHDAPQEGARPSDYPVDVDHDEEDGSDSFVLGVGIAPGPYGTENTATQSDFTPTTSNDTHHAVTRPASTV